MSEKINFFAYQSDYYSEHEILLSYKGPVTDIILAEISLEIQKKIKENPRIFRKLHAIFIELAQNILYYSNEHNHFRKQEKVGCIIIARSEDYYHLETGNLANTISIKLLRERCKVINDMDAKSLRMYKRHMRKLSLMAGARGAGIGLIQSALLSENPLEMRSRKIDDDYTFFTLSVKIAR
jgi:hypothetical protein